MALNLLLVGMALSAVVMLLGLSCIGVWFAFCVVRGAILANSK